MEKICFSGFPDHVVNCNGKPAIRCRQRGNLMDGRIILKKTEVGPNRFSADVRYDKHGCGG